MRQVAPPLERRIEGGVVAAPQEIAEQIEGRHPWVGGLHRRQPDFNTREFSLEGHHHHARRCLGWFIWTRSGWQRTGFYGAKTLLHSTPEYVCIKIAHSNNDHIIGDIPGTEDASHILGGDARKRLFKPDNGTAVGVRGER